MKQSAIRTQARTYWELCTRVRHGRQSPEQVDRTLSFIINTGTRITNPIMLNRLCELREYNKGRRRHEQEHSG